MVVSAIAHNTWTSRVGVQGGSIHGNSRHQHPRGTWWDRVYKHILDEGKTIVHDTQDGVGKLFDELQGQTVHHWVVHATVHYIVESVWSYCILFRPIRFNIAGSSVSTHLHGLGHKCASWSIIIFPFFWFLVAWKK